MAKIYDTVSEDDSGPISKEVSRLDGIPVGISSGAAIWAALQVAQRPKSAGNRIVVIVPSASERYLSSRLFQGVTPDSDILEIEQFAGVALAK